MFWIHAIFFMNSNLFMIKFIALLSAYVKKIYAQRLPAKNFLKNIFARLIYPRCKLGMRHKKISIKTPFRQIMLPLEYLKKERGLISPMTGAMQAAVHLHCRRLQEFFHPEEAPP